MRAVETGRHSLSPVAGVTGGTVARHVVEDAAGIDPQQPVAGRHLDDVQVAGGIELRAERLAQGGARGGDPGVVLAATGHELNASRTGCVGR
jgi:hypothetical protein